MSSGPDHAALASEPLTKEQLDILRKLARGVLPLQDWIQSKRNRYKPEDNPSWLESVLDYRNPRSVPWRNTSIDTDDLGAIEHLLETLRAPDDLPARHRRWAEIQAEPLRFSPVRDATHWRRDRGLDAQPVFDPFLAGNEIVWGNGAPLDRRIFYRDFADTLLRICGDLELERADRARQTAEELWQDKFAEWPAASPKSSLCLAQFARDLLAAVMGMRNRSPRTDSPLWKYAVLIELGEHRRAGNAHTPLIAHKTVELFDHRLREQIA